MKFFKEKKYSILLNVFKYSFVILFITTLLASTLFRNSFVSVANAATVKISNITPMKGSVGDTIVITGIGLDDVSLIVFNTKDVYDYNPGGPNKISVAVPVGATSGKITLKTFSGDSVTSQSDFIVTPSAVVTNIAQPINLSVSKITPTSASVQLTGLNKDYRYAVVYTNTTSGYSLTMAATKQADGSAVANLTGLMLGTTYNIGVDYIDNTGFKHTNESSKSFITPITDNIDSIPPSSQQAVIYDFSPTGGKVGDLIVINGDNFNGLTEVLFNTTKAVTTTNSLNEISVKVPKNATSGKITITTKYGRSSSAEDFIVGGVAATTTATPATQTTTTPREVGKPATGVTIKFNGLVPVCNTGAIDQSPNGKNYVVPCNFDMLMALINRMITFVLVDLATPLFAIIIIYVAWLFLSSGGSTENVSKAKKIFTNVVIGYVIALAAWLIVKTILATLGFDPKNAYLNV